MSLFSHGIVGSSECKVQHESIESECTVLNAEQCAFEKAILKSPPQLEIRS